MADKNILVKPLMGVFKTGKWVAMSDTAIVQNGVYTLGYEQLRNYQKEILQLKEETKLPHLSINCPPGAGKSKTYLAITSKREKNTKNLVIVSTPQRGIGRNFLSSTGDSQKILDHLWLINPQNQLCENVYKNEDGNIARVKEVLSSPRSADLNDRMIICCHATLAMLFDSLTSEEKKKLFRDVRLCIDESHHSLSQEDGGNGLGKVVNYFLKHSDRNLELTMMTATPFRGDKGSLIPEKYFDQFCRYTLDCGRHFEENCHGLEFVYNVVLHQYGACYGKVVEELMNKYLSRDDKVLVQIPPSNKAISNGKFTDLQMIYDAIGKTQKVDKNGIILIKRENKWIRVLDLITEKDRVSRMDYIAANPDKIDVVIGIAMIKEAFDWPPANAGILIGAQGSLTAQYQLMGRMFRDYINKGKDRGMKPVEITQIFPYIDHLNLDEDGVRKQINEFMKVVYAALAGVLVINPIHIELPVKFDDKGNPKPRESVKSFLLDNLTETQYVDLMEDVMNDYRDWKATAGEDENISDKISEIVSQKLTELGIDENHEQVAEFFNKTLQRSAKFQLMAMDGIDVSHIDIDLMADIDDPIDSILMGMSNGLCGAKDIKEFQLLMKPVDTLRRCYELKEWVERNGRFPSKFSDNRLDRSLYAFINYMRATRRKNYGEISESHVEILESIQGWRWDQDTEKTVKKCYEIKDWVGINNRLPSQTSDDEHERALSRFITTMRGAKKGINKVIITDVHIQILESISGWKWEYVNRCLELKEWVLKNMRLPTNSGDSLEQSLARYVTYLKNYKKGSGGNRLEKEDIELIESIPNWDWDKRRDLIKNRCLTLKQWITDNERFPNLNAQDVTEQLLAKHICRMRSSKKGIGNTKIDDAHINILESIVGWSWNRKGDKLIHQCDNLKNWCLSHGRLPRAKAIDRDERKLYKFMDCRKQGYRKAGGYKIDESQIKILEGIPNWKW